MIGLSEKSGIEIESEYQLTPCICQHFALYKTIIFKNNLICALDLISMMQIIFNGGFKTEIREQMCIETNFRYEFPILGRFGHSGLQKKKSNCDKYTFLRLVFFMISWAKIILSNFLKIP